MAYTFEQVFAADPANPSNIAQNAAVTIFAPGDSSMTPLAITDPDGQPLANPIIVNANGFGSAFAHATLDRVAWAGGSFTGFFTSYEGMKQVAIDAQAAAETAAATAGAAAQAELEARIAAGEFTGADGEPGSNVLPTDTAIANAVNGTGATKTALNATYAPKLEPDLITWHMGLANRHTTRAVVACLGDSVTEGEGSTGFDKRWVARAQDRLRALYPTGTKGGAGFIPTKGTWTVSSTMPAPATIAGSVGTSEGFGPKRNTSLLGGGGSVEWTVTGTSVDVVCTSGEITGALSVTVDGGAPTVIDTNSGTLVLGKTYRVTLGASGTHTVNIAHSSGPNVYLDGIIVYDGDENAGIGVYDCGHQGWTTANWLSNRSYYPGAIAALKPSLVAITLGYNDIGGAMDPATFQTNLANIISDIRNASGSTPPAFLLHALPARSGFVAGWPAYVAAMKAVADADPAVTFLDQSERWPNGATSAAFYSDGTHPSNLGHAALADTLTTFIAPR